MLFFFFKKMMKEQCWSSVCHNGTPSMLLVTFRHSRIFIKQCVTNIHGRKRSSYNTAMHSPTLLICACKGFIRRTVNFSSIHQQSRPNHSNYHWLEFIKDKIQGQDHMTCEVVQEAIHHCLLIAETELHC